MLRVAGRRKEAEFSASPFKHSDPVTNTSSTSIVIQQPIRAGAIVDPSQTSAIDRNNFSQNVFRSDSRLPGMVTQPVVQPVTQNNEPTASRYGRVYKPVARLIDEVSR